MTLRDCILVLSVFCATLLSSFYGFLGDTGLWLCESGLAVTKMFSRFSKWGYGKSAEIGNKADELCDLL